MIMVGSILLLASIHTMNIFGVSMSGIGGVSMGVAMIVVGVKLAKR